MSWCQTTAVHGVPGIQLQRKYHKNIITSTRYTSLHSLKSLIFKPSPLHVRHSDLDFCLDCILGTVIGEFGRDAIAVTVWGSPSSNPLRAKQHFADMCPHARAQLFTVVSVFQLQ